MKEMDGAYSMCWGRGEVHTVFWCQQLKEGNHLEELGADGTIKLKWICKKWVVGVDLTDLALGRDK
jgi:hypothetical protein